jgi:hypothetical protein
MTMGTAGTLQTSTRFCHHIEMADSDPLVFAAKCAAMTDAELVMEYGKIQDLHRLSVWEQAVVDELKEREVDV